MELRPCRKLEKALEDIHQVFQQAKTTYWHCFGGLYAITNNGGVIPDGDLDICCFYPESWERIAKLFEGVGWTRGKVVLADGTNNAVFMGVENRSLDIYCCISFWYKWKELYFWCHDEKQEISPNGIGTPKGYWFKGCPSELLEGEGKFILVEWPGISGRLRVRVPLLAGELLDIMYPGWPYRIQRYNVEEYQYQPEKTISLNDPVYCRGVNIHASSPHKVHIASMKDWEDEAGIRGQLDESRQKWEQALSGRYKE